MTGEINELSNDVDLLDCPFCGSDAELFYEFDIPRCGCSDEDCPACFGDDGIDIHIWNQRSYFEHK